MSKVYFTDEHEWLSVEGDIATVGITNHAQEQLGDLVFVELPEPGTKIEQGEDAAVVESVKAASDVYAPVTGEVVEINGALEGDAAIVNASAESAGWLYKVKLANPAELESLLDAAAYQALVS